MLDNPQFLGPLPPHEVAERINQSAGPSGEHRDNLLQLEESLRELSAASGDAHISDLARRVRSMAPKQADRIQGRYEEMGIHKANSTEEQEAIEKDC
jgi:glutathione-specific gamma-glutamylcyclotransferase